MEQFYFLPKPKRLPKKSTLDFILNFSKSVVVVPNKDLEQLTFVKN